MDLQLKAERERASELGLTLIEVLISVLILGLAISTIMGLQGSILRRSIQDRNQRSAMLIARSVLAAIEKDPEAVEEQNTIKPADKLLQELLGDDGIEIFKSNKKDEGPNDDLLLNDYKISLNAQNMEVPIPNTDQNSIQLAYLREFKVTVYWGEESDENLEVLYFARVNPLKKEEDSQQE